MALGRAISAWEGVNAEVNSLAHALLQHLPEQETLLEIKKLTRLHKTHERAKFLRVAGRSLLSTDFADYRDDAKDFERDLIRESRAYVEWAARRNDLAHGYVTETQSPDYALPDQPVVTFYALLPSHARIDRWFSAEPEWKYLASAIERFAENFKSLDDRIERLVHRAAALAALRCSASTS